MKIPKNIDIGESFETDFSSTDIDAEILAEKLGVSEYRFSNEQYLVANSILLRIIDRILPHLKGKSDTQIGDYLYEHVDEIMGFCDGFEHMGRFPALITKESLILYEDTFRETLQMSEREYYHGIFSCMHFMVYLSGIKKFGALQARYQLPGMLYQVDRVVHDEGHMELSNAWGGRLCYHYEKIVSPEKRKILGGKYAPSSYTIPGELIDVYKKKVIDFWLQADLPPERILIDVVSLARKHWTGDQLKKIAELDVVALNFFLCQTDATIYIELVKNIFSKPDHYASWEIWIHNHIDELRQHGSEVNKIFRAVFDLWDKKIFISNRGKLTSDAKANLPEMLQMALLESEKEFLERQPVSTNKAVAGILESSPYKSSPKPQQAKASTLQKKFDLPPQSSLFVRGAEKKQLRQLNLSGVNFPEGTTVQFERQIPRGKRFETLPAEIGQLNDITPILGHENKGQFLYRLTIILPSEYRFSDGKMRTVLEQKIYAEADPTPEETEAQKNKKTAPIHPVLTPPKTAPLFVPTVKTVVASILEKPAKTLSDTVTAWEWALEEKLYTFELREDEAVVFHLNSDLKDELHDTSFGTLLITPDGFASPVIQKNEILTQLQEIARELREKKRAEHNLALQAVREQAEYETLRVQFQPFYDFIAEQTFVDKNNKELFDKASDNFKSSLRGLQWGMPWRITKDGQIQFRHIRNDIKITYSNLGVFLNVAGEKRTLSKAEERCYHEIAEAFSHLALFYTAEYRERQKMISKEKKFQKDTLKEVEAYEALLDEGKGRIVRYSSGEKGRIYVSKFPLDDKPQMIAEKVGHDTVEKSLQEHEHSELCYRRDIVRINGEIGEDAGEQSLENTHQNLLDLRQSPRARFILRKRILITLDYEKFLGDDRRPIQPEKDGKKKTSAFEILHSLKNAKNIESKDQIDEEFMDSYIDLLIQHKIRIQYVWPLSVSLAEHRKQLEKIQKQKKPTAD